MQFGSGGLLAINRNESKSPPRATEYVNQKIEDRTGVSQEGLFARVEALLERYHDHRTYLAFEPMRPPLAKS